MNNIQKITYEEYKQELQAETVHDLKAKVVILEAKQALTTI